MKSISFFQDRIRIETTAIDKASITEKETLLKELVKKFLRAQGCKVTKHIRITSTKIDLLCRHRTNRKTIYIECRALRKQISIKTFTSLLGTIVFKNFMEGWLLSTESFGESLRKDAKEFQAKWEVRPFQKQHRLQIYPPEGIIGSLVSDNVIVAPPFDAAEKMLFSRNHMGVWTLLITRLGEFWTVSCLENGVSEGVLVYSAINGESISDKNLLRSLARMESTLKTLDFEYVFHPGQNGVKDIQTLPEPEPIATVQHGETWSDHRPAHPDQFVGRHGIQQKLIRFLESVRQQKTPTRVFEISGDEGLGKSSLIAKLRHRLESTRREKKTFLYAVDVRAAKSPGYILHALLACLRKSAELGFGKGASEELKIYDRSAPLAGPTVLDFLKELERRKQIVCLVFDNFEELYEKPDLYPVFEQARQLFMSAISACSNLVLGFAWRSSCTVSQLPPDCFLYQNLPDLRLKVSLCPFEHSEMLHAIRLFGNELGQKIIPELRHYLIENSHGYPWLLKKFCIYLHDQLNTGISQTELSCKAHDITSLKPPSFPFTYIPSSPSFRSLLSVAKQLDKNKSQNCLELGKKTGLKNKTVEKTVRDLMRFGVATGGYAEVRLDSKMEGSNPGQVMERIRFELKRHALTIKLLQIDEDVPVTEKKMIQMLKEINPAAKHRSSTWRIHSLAMGKWLSATGFLSPVQGGWIRKDLGAVSEVSFQSRKRKQALFIGTAPPARVVEVFEWLRERQPQTMESVRSSGYRNAMAVLIRFDLARYKGLEDVEISDTDSKGMTVEEIIWHASKADETLQNVTRYLQKHPSSNGLAVGKFISDAYKKNWTRSTEMRIGNSLKQWGGWILSGQVKGRIPDPPGPRVRAKIVAKKQRRLFE